MLKKYKTEVIGITIILLIAGAVHYLLNVRPDLLNSIFGINEVKPKSKAVDINEPKKRKFEPEKPFIRPDGTSTVPDPLFAQRNQYNVYKPGRIQREQQFTNIHPV